MEKRFLECFAEKELQKTNQKSRELKKNQKKRWETICQIDKLW